MSKKEDEDYIILTNEVTPPIVGTKEKLSMIKDKKWLLKKAEEEEKYPCVSVRGESFVKIVGKDGVWKKDNYIIGKYVEGDEKHCEPVNPLDMIDSAIIRELITKVENFLTKKDNKRNAREAKYNALKNFFWFLVGASAVLWALYAGMIQLVS